MYENLFKLEALLKAAHEAADPLLMSNSDIGTLEAIMNRVMNRAERVVQSGKAVRQKVL